MKKFISILAIIALILVFSACNNNLPDNSLDSEQEEQENQQTEKLVVSHNTQSKDVYTAYALGEYYGNNLDYSYDIVDVGMAEYEIIESYGEAKRITEYGVTLDKELFDNSYIVVIRCLYRHDTAGLIGFRNLRMEDEKLKVTIVHNDSGIVDNNELYYLEVPRSEIINWSDIGVLHIEKESANYIKTMQISVDNDFRQLDALTELMSREELLSYIKDRNLPINEEKLDIAPSYLVCFSKNRFDNVLAFTNPIVERDTITISRNYNLSDKKDERAFLNIIPLDVKNIDSIKYINLNSYIIEKGATELKDYKIDNATIKYSYVDFYKTFRGGVYYGTELAEKQHSSYTIIETHRELLDKAEFYIDEEIFKDNCVLVLKLVGVDPQRLGFANASVVWEETTDGQGACSLEIELYLTPYYEQILYGSIEDLKEEIYDEEYYKNKIEYEYVVVPKSHLEGAWKTGDLSISANTTFNDFFEPDIIKKDFDNTNYSLQSGDTYHITTKVEMQDFNKRFGTNFNASNIGGKYYREYYIVYLEDKYDYKIFQSAERSDDTSIYISYLVENEKATSKKSGYFLCIERDSIGIERQIIIENTVINYGSYPSCSVEQNITSYDFYAMDLHYSKKLDWKYKLLTDYTQFTEMFDAYKHDEIEDNITADMVFDEATFENNYILAVNLIEGGSGMIKKGFYNARVGGNKMVYLYAFERSSSGTDAMYDMLYFISIPKAEIPTEISGVRVEVTNEIIYNGPFDNVIIASPKEEDVKLEESYLIINSYEELESIVEGYSEYEKLQNIDFENNFILAFNRRFYTTSEYLYGDFVNFTTTVHGTASITFMSEKHEWISDYTRTYILDLVIIPKEYLRHEVKYFYIRYEKYSEPFEPDGMDRIELPDNIEY